MNLRVAALIAPLALGACGSEPAFDHLYYRGESEPPGTARLRPREVTLQMGIAVKARVSAIDEDGDVMPRLELQSSDRRVFAVDVGPTYGEFVFYGVSEGTAELDVFSDRAYEGSLPVEVTVE